MDSDADAIGGDNSVEEHEDSDNDEESESVGESESDSSEEEEDESESESENRWNESGVWETVTENLIRRLKANDETLNDVWADSGDELRQVCAAVQDNCNVSFFSLRGIVIDQNAASAITTVLARMPRLSHFGILNCNNVDFEATEMLANSLSDKGSIQMIQWCGCNLGEREARVIAARFSGNTQIQEIILARNNIGNDGAIAIASLIERNTSITKLSLSHNNIGAEGARRLAQAIVRNQVLKELFILGNSQACSDAAADAFKTAMYNDLSIETVVSGSNHTIKHLHYTSGEKTLIDLHRDGPEKARRAKIIRFLNEQPTSLFSANLDATLMPSALDKIGRDCILNTMF